MFERSFASQFKHGGHCGWHWSPNKVWLTLWLTSCAHTSLVHGSCDGRCVCGDASGLWFGILKKWSSTTCNAIAAVPYCNYKYYNNIRNRRSQGHCFHCRPDGEHQVRTTELPPHSMRSADPWPCPPPINPRTFASSPRYRGVLRLARFHSLHSFFDLALFSWKD